MLRAILAFAKRIPDNPAIWFDLTTVGVTSLRVPHSTELRLQIENDGLKLPWFAESRYFRPLFRSNAYILLLDPA